MATPWWKSHSPHQKLQDQVAFRQVHLAFGTLEWPCGTDLDAEFVYENQKGASMKQEPVMASF